MKGTGLAQAGMSPSLGKTIGYVSNGIYHKECSGVESSLLLYLLIVFGCSLLNCIAFAWVFPSSKPACLVDKKKIHLQKGNKTFRRLAVN